MFDLRLPGGRRHVEQHLQPGWHFQVTDGGSLGRLCPRRVVALSAGGADGPGHVSSHFQVSCTSTANLWPGFGMFVSVLLAWKDDLPARLLVRVISPPRTRSATGKLRFSLVTRFNASPLPEIYNKF